MKIMKIMTCKQLGGACDKKFHANTFEEIAELSKQHGMEMYKNNDKPHMDAMEEMKELMSNPDEMQKWMNGKRMEFDQIPEN